MLCNDPKASAGEIGLGGLCRKVKMVQVRPAKGAKGKICRKAASRCVEWEVMFHCS